MKQSGGGTLQQHMPIGLPANTAVTVKFWIKQPHVARPENKVVSAGITAFSKSGDAELVGGEIPFASPNWSQPSYTIVPLFDVFSIRISVTTGGGDGEGPPEPVWLDDFELSYALTQ